MAVNYDELPSSSDHGRNLHVYATTARHLATEDEPIFRMKRIDWGILNHGDSRGVIASTRRRSLFTIVTDSLKTLAINERVCARERTLARGEERIDVEVTDTARCD